MSENFDRGHGARRRRMFLSSDRTWKEKEEAGAKESGSRATVSLSPTKLKEVQKCFGAFDEGKKGFLDKDDLKCAVTALLGSRPTKYEVQRLLEAAAKREPACPGLRMVDPVEETRDMFRAFDKGCRGFITREDLRQVLVEVCGPGGISPSKVAGMFAEANWDGSGRIGYQQFERMVLKDDVRPPDSRLSRR